MADTITVEVAYALPEKQRILVVQVPVGSSLLEAARLSGIQREFPSLDLESAKMGIFGKAVRNLAEAVQDGDRIEIYRPLIIDPKQARANRAAKAKA
ncbi:MULTISPECIES: RnfH family protein [unclassified Oceanobacter]|uniref:RnfH family protein n=1 Tax=unclassified Oceanobacter TaxID=2620260 RepID=UPI0027354465|nr:MULTISPECIES: RnfH family protein [unclassified Oceanobacter]MDP2505080.1 RnfH family protein [Oceanobacter sp. 3_MG-2023]MDP2548204.1 RnfH family protein [Oceanobacter sp. 4_MG-2023]